MELLKSPNGETSVKIMKKASYVFSVQNYTARVKRTGVGNSIASPPFVVGGYSFSVQFYPHGKDRAAHAYGRMMSASIRNESAKMVFCISAIHILDQSGSDIHQGYSSFDQDRGRSYRHVLIIEPGGERGSDQFSRELIESEYPEYYLNGDCLKIRAIIGVFIDQPLPFANVLRPFDRCIFFQVDRYLVFAEESVLGTRCPTLLSYCDSQSNSLSKNIVIPDIEHDVFVGVIWFIYNQQLHLQDKVAIYNSRPDDMDSFFSKMLAAADRFNLKSLRRQCESINFFGNAEVLELFYAMKRTFEKSWRNLRWLWDSEKIKEA
ncbi:hypothetical protein C2S53_003520 [Perilla frutescens var. hirtella]|uniref:MATH domain-containing protein n=1 Tax=Perilla frutescens var. hirtella TaxID=608512 RepID=A0AAD4IX62_PERFH|nr:hypothetical protein C2S53_003520 [Perilla frutescens var. hirtella]